MPSSGPDAPVYTVTDTLVQPAIFWGSQMDRRTLPWRIIPALLAILPGTEVGYAFAVANML